MTSWRRCVALLVAVGLAPGLVSGSLGVAAGPEPQQTWSHEEEVPPAGVPHSQSLAAAFPDGTLVTVWLHFDPRPEDPPGVLLRSTRPPGGAWSDPEVFPVQDVARLNAIAAGTGGGIEIAYQDASITRKEEQVRTWNADGSVGEVLLESNEAFDLEADAEGDVVATRLGRYTNGAFNQVVRYRSAVGWRKLPSVRAHPGQVFRPGAGDAVWIGGYDGDRTRLLVRRWTPTTGRWNVEWSRDYDRAPQYKPFVQGVDLALGGAGRATFAFQQREVRNRGASVRVVQRAGRSDWTKPQVLEQLPAGQRLTASAPVVAAAGELGAVSWSSSVAGNRLRDVNVAWLVDGAVDKRRLGVTDWFDGYRDLSLDVDLRADGELLMTYLGRRGHRRQVVAWAGSRNQLEVTVLVRDAGVPRSDSAFLVTGLAAVIATASEGRSVSFVRAR